MPWYFVVFSIEFLLIWIKVLVKANLLFIVVLILGDCR